MKKQIQTLFVCILVIAAIALVSSFKNTVTIQEQKSKAIECKAFTNIDFATIERITGMKGVEKNGEFKLTVPQNDLHVIVDGFKIIPFMGLGSWIAFTPHGSDAMLMGDIVLTETDLAPVQSEVVKQGLSITAIHNHFVRNHPNILYMHIDGKGTVEKLAIMAKAVFDKVKESRGVDPKSAKPDSVLNSLNTQELDNTFRVKGEINKGVYKFTIGRPDIQLTEDAGPVSTFMGFNTWAAWQGTPEKAAVCGDFTMLENEVQPVIASLVSNGFEIVALHNHMVEESPKVFFLHYWGTGSADKLVNGLKDAISKTGKH